MHSGARLATVGVTFVVKARPSALPSSPAILLVRSTTQYLCPTPANAQNWAPLHSYATTDPPVVPLIHVPDLSSHYGFTYACTVNGTSAASEPAWPTTIGATVTDGTATWKCIAALTPYTSQWTANHAIPLNTYVSPTNANGAAQAFYFKATSISGTGTTAALEPAWPLSVGATVTDNTGANQVVWTCVGHSGLYPTAGQTLDTLYNNGDPISVQADFDTTGFDFSSNIVDTTASVYQVTLFNPDPSWLITSLFVVMDTITDMRFE